VVGGFSSFEFETKALCDSDESSAGHRERSTARRCDGEIAEGMGQRL